MALEFHRDSDENNKHTPKGFTAALNNSYAVKSEKGLSVYDQRNVLPQAINFVDGNAAPPTSASGDIYVLIDLGNGTVDAGWGGASYNDWVRSDGAAYFNITPLVGDLCNSAAGDWYKFDGAQWVLFGVGATDTNIANANLSLDAVRTTDMNGFNLTITNGGAAATLGIHNETTDFGTAGSGLRLLAAGGAFQMASTSRLGAQEFFVLHTPAGQTTFSHATAQGFRVIEDVGGQVQMVLQNNQFALAPTIEPISKFYVLGQGTDNTTNNLYLRNAGLNPLLTVKNGGEIVIGQTPATDNTNNNILVRDGVTGAIELRDAGTIGGDGNGIYDGSGIIPTTTVATLTDTINFSGGEVGIGITPTAKLHVKGADLLGTSSALLVENSGGASTLLDVRNNGDTTINGTTLINSTTTFPLRVKNTTANALSVFSADCSGTNSAQIWTAPSTYTGTGSGYIAGHNLLTSNVGNLLLAARNLGSSENIQLGITSADQTTFSAKITVDNNGAIIPTINGDTSVFGLLAARGSTNDNTAFAFVAESNNGNDIILARNDNAIGLYGATPVVQATTAGAAATLAAGTGSNIKLDDTFDGYTVAQVVKALRNLGILA